MENYEKSKKKKNQDKNSNSFSYSPAWMDKVDEKKNPKNMQTKIEEFLKELKKQDIKYSA